MFGFGIPWFKIGVAAAVALVIFLGYRYVTDLQEEDRRKTAVIATQQASIATLNQAVATQEAAIAKLEADQRLANEIQQGILEEFGAARNRVRDLEDKLGRHELGFLAANRPGLVENIINNATQAIGRCFEIATGSPLTEKELAADRPSLYNSECPELANPKSRNQ